MAWPTTGNPRTTIITLRLSATDLAALDALTTATQAPSRSAAIRTALQQAATRVAHPTSAAHLTSTKPAKRPKPTPKGGADE